MTDVCGMTLEAVAAAAALCAVERSTRWIAVWVVALIALSITRDSSVFLVLGSVWVAVRSRSRRTLIVAATGVAAAAPVPLLLGAPAREEMACIFSKFYEPPNDSWGWVASRYWANGLDPLMRTNIQYLQAHPLTALYLVGGYLGLFLTRSRGDPFFRFFRAAAVGSILLDALEPNYTAFRLELRVVPIAAAGLAVTVDRVWNHVRAPASRPLAWRRE